MKNFYLSVLIFLSMISCADAQKTGHRPVTETEKKVNLYLNTIRNRRAELTAFFYHMPKGADLHHHYSGSVYAETYLDYVIQKDFWINTRTLEISNSEPKPGKDMSWTRFSMLAYEKTLSDYRDRLLRHWSVRDFREGAPDRHFFDSFEHFGPAARETTEEGYKELCHRAKMENLQYMETSSGLRITLMEEKDMENLQKLKDMERLRSPSAEQQAEIARLKAAKKEMEGRDAEMNGKLNALTTQLKPNDAVLLNLQEKRDEKQTLALLREMFGNIHKTVKDPAIGYNRLLQYEHRNWQLEDEQFMLRHHNIAGRKAEPVEFFVRLVMAFASAADTTHGRLIVGVNIAAPENSEVALRDYWLHMRMFRVCADAFPSVRYSMHAGELNLNLAKPEDLNWHIDEAVRVAGAHRIGHGTDLPYERNCYSLLEVMKEKQVAVEINLSSNEFILQVSGDSHPLMMYKEAGVPVVISTDDAAILRTTISEQYILLAHRYAGISYSDIKDFVYNSLTYSFLSHEQKARQRRMLDQRFEHFEQEISRRIKN